jgi:hypothetical protein
LGLQVLAGLVPVIILLWANTRSTGHAFVFGYEALNGPEHAVGFHRDPAGDLHTPLRGVRLASGYLLRLDRYLFEWPIPSLLIVVVGLLAVRNPSRWDVLLATLALGFIAGYGTYWFDGFFSGPRFLFTAVPAFVYFATRSVGPFAVAVRRPTLRRAVLLIVPLCMLASWAAPDGVSSARARLGSYRRQRTKMKTDIDAQIARAGIHNALVFVNEGWRGRLLARLRVLGATQFQAERMASSLDACGLQTALDSEDSLTSHTVADRLRRVQARARAVGMARLEPGMSADQVIALVPGSRPTSVCIREYQHDTLGTIPYAIFLTRQHVGATGRVQGNIVFARDLVERNERLRARFGDRAWFTYRPARDDSVAAFLPYQRRNPPTN